MTACPLELLHAIAGPDATFHPGQREAIDAVVADRRRVLLVQRTGWASRPCPPFDEDADIRSHLAAFGPTRTLLARGR